MNIRLTSSLINFRQILVKRPARVWVLSTLWLCLIGGVAFFWNLGNVGLVDETEPLFAEAARQMTVTGDWITPYFNQETRFDKPPLIYWLMAICYQSFGVNEWSVRLPSALAAFALVCFGFYILWQYGHPLSQSSDVANAGKTHQPGGLIAWIGSAMIALNPETIAWARIGVSDMLLTGCMGGALLSFFRGYATPRPLVSRSSLLSQPWYLAFYILLALAVLTKGPIGIVLPGLIISTFILYLGNWKEVLREMHLVAGGCVFSAITLPWYILVTFANGQAYVDSFFGYHNFQRFTQVVNHHSAPWYFYFIVVLLGFFPWSIYLPAALFQTQFWQRRYWQHQPRQQHLKLFALFWFVCIFGFFTLAVTKLPSYVLPLMPAGAILVAFLWQDICQNSTVNFPQKPTALVSYSFNFNRLFLLVLGAVLAYSFHWMGEDPAMPNFPAVIQESGILMRGTLIWIGIAVLISFFQWKRQYPQIWTANFIGLVIFILFAVTPAMLLVDQERQLPLRELSQTIIEEMRPGERIIMVSFEKPSVVFYTHQPVSFFRRATEARIYLEELAKTEPLPATVLMLGYPDKFADTGLNSDQYHVLSQKGAYQLARVYTAAFVN